MNDIKLHFNTDQKVYTNKELNESQKKHFIMLNELIQLDKLNDNQVDTLINDYDNVLIKTFMQDSYFHNGYAMCKVYIDYCYSKPIDVYVSVKKLHELMSNKEVAVYV